MSREQANTFKKYRDAEDVPGNLAWAARLSHKALRQGPEAIKRIDVEKDFELTDDEKIVWRLMRLPRRYIELEHAGVLGTDKVRGFLRGLVAADVVDIIEVTDAKALIPAEVKRMKAELAGKELPKTEPLRGRVYRPSLDKPGEGASESASSSAATPAAVAPAQAIPPPAVVNAPARAPTPVPAKPTLSNDDRLYKGEIERAFAAAQKQNHYEFLGLRRPTDDAAVRAAYMRLAREYHPDRVSGILDKDEGLKQKVDVLFKRLGEAQSAVATAEARSSYDRTVESLGDSSNTGADGKKVRRPHEAKNAFMMAETYFKKKDIKQAEAHYRQAVMFDGEDARILTGLAWCIWQNSDHPETTRTAEARKRLNEVINLYKYGDAAYKLGLILRKQNDEGAAQRQFALAHKLDPEHMEAGREIRLSEMRHKKEDDKKDSGGLFGKFLKK